MGEHTSKHRVAGEQSRSTLGALIHAAADFGHREHPDRSMANAQIGAW